MSESDFQALMDKKLAECRIPTSMSIEQLAVMCQMFTTSVCEVTARVQMVNGSPVAFFVREVQPAAIPQYLRRAS